jgi:hypothetical protein
MFVQIDDRYINLDHVVEVKYIEPRDARPMTQDEIDDWDWYDPLPDDAILPRVRARADVVTLATEGFYSDGGDTPQFAHTVDGPYVITLHDDAAERFVTALDKSYILGDGNAQPLVRVA